MALLAGVRVWSVMRTPPSSGAPAVHAVASVARFLPRPRLASSSSILDPAAALPPPPPRASTRWAHRRGAARRRHSPSPFLTPLLPFASIRAERTDPRPPAASFSTSSSRIFCCLIGTRVVVTSTHIIASVGDVGLKTGFGWANRALVGRSAGVGMPFVLGEKKRRKFLRGGLIPRQERVFCPRSVVVTRI